MPRTCEIPAIGLPYIDEQHERLIAILHELDSSVSRNMKIRIVRESLLKIDEFCGSAFLCRGIAYGKHRFPRT